MQKYNQKHNYICNNEIYPNQDLISNDYISLIDSGCYLNNAQAMYYVRVLV